MKIPLSDSIFRDSFREPREIPAHFARIRNYLEIVLSAISFRGTAVGYSFGRHLGQTLCAYVCRHLVERTKCMEAIFTNISIYLHSNTYVCACLHGWAKILVVLNCCLFVQMQLLPQDYSVS